MLRTGVRIEPVELGSVRFSWKVPQLIAGADLASRESDDSPVRVVLVFEGDRSRFSARDAMLSELVHALTGEEMLIMTDSDNTHTTAQAWYGPVRLGNSDAGR
jgi:hypothetical protein